MPALFSGVAKPKKKKADPIKPTGAPTSGKTTKSAQQIKEAELNGNAPGYGSGAPSPWPTVYQARTSDTQPQVSPFIDPTGIYGAASADSTGTGAGTYGAASATTSGTATPGGVGSTTNGPGATTALGQQLRNEYAGYGWDNPEALIDAYYRVVGANRGSGDYGTLLQQAPDLGILYMALNGANAFNLDGQTSFNDWTSNYLDQQRNGHGTPISSGQILNALINPGQGDPLNMYLNNPTLDPSDQVNNMLSAAKYGLDTTMPGPIKNAYLAQMDQMGREFQSWRMLHNGANSFSDYLRSRPNSLPIPQ